jgi:hypothetical protein
LRVVKQSCSPLFAKNQPHLVWFGNTTNEKIAAEMSEIQQRMVLLRNS